MGVSLEVTSDNHLEWDTRSYASYNGKSEIVAYIDSKMRERTNSVVECRGLHTKSGCELDQLIAAAEVGCSKRGRSRRGVEFLFTRRAREFGA